MQAEIATAPAVEPQQGLNDCWNKIGVYGDRSCEELRRCVHCRHCSIYSQAGVKLLDRALTSDYRRERTEHFAQRKTQAAAGKISALIFRINTEWLGLPTEVFQEVAQKRPVHSLPHRRLGVVLGLINIRGELTICVSLGRLLGIQNPELQESRQLQVERFLVVNWGDTRLAFPVNEIHGIERFDPQLLKEPPSTVAKSSPAFSRGIFRWQERTVGLLDPDALFGTLNRNLA